MPRGGARPGAGRWNGSKGGSGLAPLPKSSLAPDLGEGITPLEYMLSVIRDPAVEPFRRDRMAVAAAPYCHPRMSDQRVTKKELKAKAANTAGKGTQWGDELGEIARIATAAGIPLALTGKHDS